MEPPPTLSIVIPTRARPRYLDVALASMMGQARAVGAEVLVVRDGDDAETPEVVRRHGARLVAAARGGGANAARNVGVAASSGELVVFTDDDIEAPPGWLGALLTGVRKAPHHDVFGGPIRGRLEGRAPRGCGREPPPITTLDLGNRDVDAEFVWSANMAIRRRAFERVGAFDETVFGRGEEEEWQRRYKSQGGRIRYLAAASVVHRRAGRDARLRSLARAAYALGRTARRNDVRNGRPPRPGAELRVLAGCGWHTVRRRCAYGIVMGAHTLGRIREWALEGRR